MDITEEIFKQTGFYNGIKTELENDCIILTIYRTGEKVRYYCNAINEVVEYIKSLKDYDNEYVLEKITDKYRFDLEEIIKKYNINFKIEFENVPDKTATLTGVRNERQYKCQVSRTSIAEQAMCIILRLLTE